MPRGRQPGAAALDDVTPHASVRQAGPENTASIHAAGISPPASQWRQMTLRPATPKRQGLPAAMGGGRPADHGERWAGQGHSCGVADQRAIRPNSLSSAGSAYFRKAPTWGAVRQTWIRHGCRPGSLNKHRRAADAWHDRPAGRTRAEQAPGRRRPSAGGSCHVLASQGLT